MMASRGALVVVNDLGGAVDGTGSDKGAAERVVDEIKSAGGEAVADTNSVSTAEGGKAIVQTALDAFGRIDIVVNNAGILRDKSFHNMTPDLWAPVIDVHLNGAYFVTSAAWPHMREQGYGRVVSTASGAGIFGNFGQANYGAAKMALVGFSRVLAVEGASKNIKANVIAPVAKTRMTEDLLGPLGDKVEPRYVSPDRHLPRPRAVRADRAHLLGRRWPRRRDLHRRGSGLHRPRAVARVDRRELGRRHQSGRLCGADPDGRRDRPLPQAPVLTTTDAHDAHDPHELPVGTPSHPSPGCSPLIIVPSSDGVAVAVHELGGEATSPTLLFSHATGFHARCYHPVARALGDRWHSLGLDYRGHGASSVDPSWKADWSRFGDDAEAVAAAIAPDGGLVGFGHSMGGAALLMAAHRDPARFERLVLFEPISPEARTPMITEDEIRQFPIVQGASGDAGRSSRSMRPTRTSRGKPPMSMMEPDVLRNYVDHGFRATVDEDGEPGVELCCAPELEADIFMTVVTTVCGSSSTRSRRRAS